MRAKKALPLHYWIIKVLDYWIVGLSDCRNLDLGSWILDLRSWILDYWNLD
jgi:hypothetical protein